MFTFYKFNKYLLNTPLCAMQSMRCGKYKSEKKKKNLISLFTKCLRVVVIVKPLGEKKGFYSLFMREFQVKTFWLKYTLSEAFINIMLIFIKPFLLQACRREEKDPRQPLQAIKQNENLIIYHHIQFYFLSK